MSRVYWDSMLFIYMFDGNPQFQPRVRHLLSKSIARGDELVTSYLTLGEVLSGAYRENAERASANARAFEQMGVRMIGFDSKSAHIFGQLRAKERVEMADAFHLASAASYGVDLFLTADKAILKLGKIAGIGFMASINTDLF